MATESFTPHEKEALGDIIKCSKGDEANFPHILIDIMYEFGKINFQEIEEILRAQGSQIYLMALPIDSQPDFESVLPCTEGKTYPYYLEYFITLNEANFMTYMEKRGIDRKDSFENLQYTGFRSPRLGSDLSKLYASPWN